LYQGTQSKITPLNLSSPKISQDLQIVFISDLHVNKILHRGYVQSIVNRIQKLQADFVIIGWDLMNIAKSDYADAFLPFNQIQVPVFAVLGNHDHMGDPQAGEKIFQKTKIIPLRNQTIDVWPLQIIGIDDKSYRWSQTLDEIIQRTAIKENWKFNIFVTHQPIHLSKLSNYPIDLQLAWHTHRGQFIPLSWIIGWFNDYAYWPYTQWKQLAFVSQWIWTWWAPMRMGTQSEIVLISLKKSDK
jgi:uncharacterized protein